MKYRILGNTGLNISVIGFGGIPVQRTSKQETAKAIIRAQELGVNFIDTARAYTVSEEYIGEALKGIRDSWIIATKSMARDEAGMAREVDTSLKNLQTDYIDLYQLHNIKSSEDFEKVMSDGGAYRALQKAVQEGKIGHIGVTSHSLDTLKLLVECGKFESIMYPYSIVETQGEAVFKRAAKLGIGVIAMKPLAGGAINDAVPALRFILENESVTTAIPGMADINEVEVNASSADFNYPLTGEDRAKALEAARLLGNEFCRRCGYCAPCPQGIDIPSMFLFEGYKKRYNLAGWAEARYLSCGKRAKDCIQCGACEKKCPYDLPIRQMMKNVASIFSNVDGGTSHL